MRGILNQGFDFRLAGKHGSVHGAGVNFARDSSYSLNYVNRGQSNPPPPNTGGFMFGPPSKPFGGSNGPFGGGAGGSTGGFGVGFGAQPCTCHPLRCSNICTCGAAYPTNIPPVLFLILQNLHLWYGGW